MEISIRSENEIETYITPDKKVKVDVIVYEAEGFVPRTLNIESEKLPDLVWKAKNTTKPVPADIQSQGDKARRAAIEADIAKIQQAPKARKI